MSQTFYSPGKLLLTGEYVVLDGALALAVPTKYGQSLNIETSDSESTIIYWKSIDNNGNTWFETQLYLDSDRIESHDSNNAITKRLLQILNAIIKLNPTFFKAKAKEYRITTQLEFPQNWGLGSSSTLINNIANWAKVDPYKLLELTFGGSGYDIACAQHKAPITYQLHSNSRHVDTINFNPVIKNNLFFVYLNKKQNSRDSISHYKSKQKDTKAIISKISDITYSILTCDNLSDFETLITLHESIISNIIGLDPVKNVLFSDYEGAIKSLGGWGGDFILVTAKQDPTSYFKSKGFDTIIPYTNMIA